MLLATTQMERGDYKSARGHAEGPGVQGGQRPERTGVLGLLG